MRTCGARYCTRGELKGKDERQDEDVVKEATSDRHACGWDEMLGEDESEEQAVVAATPVKESALLNGQMFSGSMPRPMYQEDEGVCFFSLSLSFGACSASVCGGWC